MVDNQRFIKDVKSANDIAQVIGEFIKVENGKAICPFHDEQEASFSINTEKQYFKCFGCGKGGDVISFVEESKKLSKKEAIIFLANRAGIPVPEGFLENSEDNEESRKHEILQEATKYYSRQVDDQVMRYLLERGIDPANMEKFQIGFADGKLKKYLLNECEFPLQLCINSGLLKEDETGNIVDFFQKRIVFPHFAHDAVVNMTGRALDDSEPRYIHLPRPKNHMYNENSLEENENIFLVEGIFDALALEANGFPTVAILGTQGFKDTFMEKVLKCKIIYICMDGDAAGIKAAEEIAEKIGEKARIITFLEELDPADFFKKYNKSEFEKLISEAKGYVQYVLDKIPKDTPLIELENRLKPVLNYLSKYSETTSEAHLKESIKPYFTNLDRDYLVLLRKSIQDMRKKVKPGSNEIFKEETAKPSAVFNNLVDVVNHDGKIQFLISENGNLSIRETYVIDGKTVTPPLLEDIPWLLISHGVNVLQHYQILKNNPDMETEKLHNDIVEYLKGISDLPDNRYYPFLGGWVIMTYLQELVNYIAMLSFFATPAKGKTRTGKALVYISYRGIAVESLYTAFIFRLARNFQATIFFDVMDIWKKAEKQGAEDILLCRYEKGQFVARVINPDKGAYKDTEYYPIYGPTIISSNKETNEILSTRCIEISMKESNKIFQEAVIPEMGAELRARLLAFRAYYMNTPLPAVQTPFRGRLGNIVKPIMQIIRLVNPVFEPEIISLISDIENARSISESETIEAKIFYIILELRDKVEFNTNGELLAINAIKNAYWKKYDVPADSKYPSNQHIGKFCTSLGFTKDTMSNSLMGIHWDESLIENLRIRYNKKIVPTPVLSDNHMEDSINSKNDPVLPIQTEEFKAFKDFKDISECTQEENHTHTDRNYRIIRDKDTLDEAIKEIYSAGYVSLDTETTSKNPHEAQLVGISFSTKPNTGWFIRVDDGSQIYLDEYWKMDELIPLIKPVLEDPTISKIGQNLKYDMVVLANAGIKLAGNIFDTLIASKVLNPDKKGHDMDTLAMELLNYKTITYDELVGKGRNKRAITEIDIDTLSNYAIEDADITLQLFEIFKKRLADDPILNRLFEEVERPLLPVLFEVELHGIKLDKEYFIKLQVDCGALIDKCSDKIHSIAGRLFNINSSAQLSEVLYDDLGLTCYTKTEKDKRSADASALDMLKGVHPIVDHVIEYKTLSKLKSTYIDALPEYIKPNINRVHTVFNQLGADTGRMSSKDPNLQNIPGDSNGISIRQGFIAEPNCQLMAADYSQIELRVAAHLSQDPIMISAFLNGEDIHRTTAAIVNGVSVDDVTDEMRRRAKTVNFGVIYGMSSYGLSKELGISDDEADNYIKAFYSKYQGFKDFVEATINKAQDCGYVTTLYGRKRFIDDINSGDKRIRSGAERIAVNTPIQGTAADLIKLAMVNIHHQLKEGKYESKMILQIHDELIFEVPEKEKSVIETLVRTEMEGVAKLEVPLVVDIAWGKNWKEAHK